MSARDRRSLTGFKEKGYEVFSVYDEAPGISDAEVLRRAHEEERILITNDKDFGEKVYRGGNPHSGIVLLRLDNERSQNKIAVLDCLLEEYADHLSGCFVVATAEQVRFAGEEE